MLFCAVAMMAQMKRTTLSAEIYGYQQDMVYFGCVQTPAIQAEFHSNPGEEHLYNFETDKLVTLIINGRIDLLLLPGDSLHVKMNYEGRAVKSAQFTGTPQAVCQNRLLWDIETLKRSMRYKSQLLACAAVDVKPQARLEDSRTLLAKVKEMIAKAGKDLAPEAAAYIMADVESDAYLSFIEYPVMYAEIRRTPLDKQGIGDYWTLMDGYTVERNDQAALRNPKYASLLMRYASFLKEKEAVKAGKKYTMPGTLEEMFKEFAGTFDGDVRDAVLYQLLCNFIRNGKELERAEPLLKEYLEKYNRDKEYAQILNNLMQ